MKEEIKFKLGDRVYAPFHGYGVVTEIKDDEQEYPIVVTWEEKQHGCISIFTPEGFAVKGLNSEDDNLTLVEKASLKGEKEMEEDSKFQVGDRVYAPFHKYGTIVEIVDTDASYPITVRWDESRYKLGGVTSAHLLRMAIYSLVIRQRIQKLLRLRGEKWDRFQELLTTTLQKR